MFYPLRFTFIICLFPVFVAMAQAQEPLRYKHIKNISYRPLQQGQDAYIAARCVLDIYYPDNLKNFPTVVYYHGGGLKFGEKYIPEGLKEKGIGVVTVNYRFYPKVPTDTILTDAAKSTAWVFKNIRKYGGSKEFIFLSGHSAGGYLVSMLGLNKSYLEKHQIDADSIAGLIPLSGHTITHMTVREEKGIEALTPVIDSMAPLYHVRKNAPPYIIITGDRDQELLGRYEENAYMMRMMKLTGHEYTEIYELQGYGHNMVAPAVPVLVNKVKAITYPKKETGKYDFP